MSEEKVKRELSRAVDTLANRFPPPLYRTIKIRDATCPFHLEVFRNHELKGEEVLKFRIALDSISDEDIALCKKYTMCGRVFTKIIACKTGRGAFKFLEV